MNLNESLGCHLFLFRSHPRVLSRLGNVASGSHFLCVWFVLLFVSLTLGIVYGREDLISGTGISQWEARASQMHPQSYSNADYPLLKTKEEYWSGEEVVPFHSKKNWPNLKKVAPPRHNRDPILRLLLGRQQKEMAAGQKATATEKKGRAESRGAQRKVNNGRQKRTGKTFYKTRQEKEMNSEKVEDKIEKDQGKKKKEEDKNEKTKKEVKDNKGEEELMSRPGRSVQGFERLQLVDGQYEGIVVKVSEKISQEDCREVIQGLQVCENLNFF